MSHPPEIRLVEKKINKSQKRDAILNYYGPFMTLGARDVSSAVSDFCQVVGLRPTTKIPTAREENLWYPGYL